ncbi:MAG: hypothetical protein LBB23_01395 [Rickettsiales bacterium]|jgi:hypothetical protein|nr:hypothetical protein [Rickettsiales bacterium]
MLGVNNPYNNACAEEKYKLASDATQLSMYKWLHKKFNHSPLLYGQSFCKISEDEYEIFGQTYLPSQIIVINADGQMTLDGNKEYYWKPEYQFAPSENIYIAQKFGNFARLDRESQIKLDQVLVVPTRYRGGDFAKRVGDIFPEEYDFTRPDEWCRALAVPFNAGQAINVGIFSKARGGIAGFVAGASRYIVSDSAEILDFRDTLHNAIYQSSQSR